MALFSIVAVELLLVASAGCRSILGCKEVSETVEVHYGPGRGLEELTLQYRREAGWDCRDVGAIFNGTRYRCTKCE